MPDTANVEMKVDDLLDEIESDHDSWLDQEQTSSTLLKPIHVTFDGSKEEATLGALTETDNLLFNPCEDELN